ncbi:hypothetical protein BaRGS_00018147, partial [Batillaria attramentaria]
MHTYSLSEKSEPRGEGNRNDDVIPWHILLGKFTPSSSLKFHGYGEEKKNQERMVCYNTAVQNRLLSGCLHCDTLAPDLRCCEFRTSSRTNKRSLKNEGNVFVSMEYWFCDFPQETWRRVSLTTSMHHYEMMACLLASLLPALQGAQALIAILRASPFV